MTDEQDIPPKARIFADLIAGYVNYSSAGATVQRSHRFPLFYFTQIENLARIGGVPVSLVINQLIECGLDAVKQELPAKIVEEMHRVRPERESRPTKSVREVVKGRNLKGKGK